MLEESAASLVASEPSIYLLSFSYTFSWSSVTAKITLMLFSRIFVEIWLTDG
ncbi:hypothetical protein DPMN_036765 [Dreissena polymorpha]|uniref:Uncharacterized protein n=1 Tax=Dreissena polymorpha TaxID=45954 RepID=A0A9D4MBF4_DREPO|nr:hypothetical protein DPMN_036765 [Dreissena polymorpha]